MSNSSRVSRNYIVEELVHPAYINQWGADKVAKYIQKYFPQMIEGQQRLREFVDAPVVVNNYHWDKIYKQYGWQGIQGRKDLRINSGLRHIKHPLGKGFSGHYFGVCTDSQQDKYTSVELQDLILEESHRHPNIVRMEDANSTSGWNHNQFGHRLPGQQIEIFKP
jgi:hypothetical protein